MIQHIGDNIDKLKNQIKEKYSVEVKHGEITEIEFFEILKQLEFDDLSDDAVLNLIKECLPDDVYARYIDWLLGPEWVEIKERYAQIKRSDATDLEEIGNVLKLVEEYLKNHPKSPVMTKAIEIKKDLEERKRWQEILKLYRGDASVDFKYAEMRKFKKEYPHTSHKTELDNMMWECTNKESEGALRNYREDWKNDEGQYVEKAKELLKYIPIITGDPGFYDDIFKLKDFIDQNSSYSDIERIRERYRELRRKIAEDMKNKRRHFPKEELDRYVSKGIFSNQELVGFGVIPKPKDTTTLPDLRNFTSKPNPDAPAKKTDIYFLGVPGTGKTCLLMGLTGAAKRAGSGYTIKFNSTGGAYAEALNKYLNAGVTPERTPGKFVTNFSGQIKETRKIRGKKTIVNHDVNFVELSGEEFAHKLANNPKTTTITDMGKGSNTLLKNNNRKVFFIVVDPTVDILTFTYFKDKTNNEGNIVGQDEITEKIHQDLCISRFVELFEMPENKEFMKRVDAIHFIVTKADTLGSTESEQKQRARELIMEKYGNSVNALIDYCRRSKRVNYSTNYIPKAYLFSLGKFDDDKNFEFNPESTNRIINSLRHITAARREKNFWDDVSDFLV